MIGMLTGTVVYRQESSLIVDVHGVGYRVLAAQDVLAKSPLGGEVKLFTHTHVREDLLELYGFANPEDLRLFELLISVSGVGCKSALGVFSIGERSQIVSAIMNGDVQFFTSVPRLGKKNAQKIIIDLKPKLGSSDDISLESLDGMPGDVVVNALKNFGYSLREAQEALRVVQKDGQQPAEKIKLALKYLGK